MDLSRRDVFTPPWNPRRMTTWCVRNDVFDSKLLDEGFISLGWDDVGDLRQYGDSQDALREGLQRTLPDAAPRSLTLWSGMLRRFAFEMQEGDRIIAPVRGKSLLNFGIVSGPYEYVPDVEHRQRRRVQWTQTGIPRIEILRTALDELNYRQTLFQVQDVTGEFNRFF